MEILSSFTEVGGVLGLISIVISVGKLVLDFRKGKADVAGTLSDATVDIVTLLRCEITDGKKEIKALERRVRRLESQLRAAGLVPANGKEEVI